MNVKSGDDGSLKSSIEIPLMGKISRKLMFGVMIAPYLREIAAAENCLE